MSLSFFLFGLGVLDRCVFPHHGILGELDHARPGTCVNEGRKAWRQLMRHLMRQAARARACMGRGGERDKRDDEECHYWDDCQWRLRKGLEWVKGE
mmetsp:Transcript_21431/g.52441  ORF Transcript_21431/g.52441 Transcript_21431/m.52441 type:complete len:96 (+) Transcript_21431:515-802(+)